MFHRLCCAALLVTAAASAACGQEGPFNLFVTAKSGNPEITLKKPDVDPEVLAAHEASDIFPAYARDGGRIAFSSNRSGKFQIHTMDAAGLGESQLSLEKRGNALAPSWSPTNSHLVYQLGGDHRWDLVVIRSDGESWRKIVHHAWQPDWSPVAIPDHTDRIVFVSTEHDNGQYLYTCLPDGRDIRKIHKLENTIGLVWPQWSPSATQIAFTDKFQKSHEIFVCGPWGENVRQLTALGGKNVYPVWSADGQAVYFWHEQPDHTWQWMSVNVETREVTTYALLPAEPFIRGGRMAWTK